MTPVRVNAMDIRERLVPISKAVEMIPFVNVGALLDWLGKHRTQFPAREMPWGRRYSRMLTLTEIAMIRSMRIETGDKRRQRRLRPSSRKRVQS